MKQALTLVTLAVEDVQRSLSFYRDELGWTPHFTNEHVGFFQLNGLAFSVFSKSGLQEDFGGAIQLNGKSIALAHNVPTREAVDEIIASISKTQGGRILCAPVERVWGGYSGYFEDPDGHLWEVAWNPHWSILEDGSVSMG